MNKSTFIYKHNTHVLLYAVCTWQYCLLLCFGYQILIIRYLLALGSGDTHVCPKNKKKYQYALSVEKALALSPKQLNSLLPEEKSKINDLRTSHITVSCLPPSLPNDPLATEDQIAVLRRISKSTNGARITDHDECQLIDLMSALHAYLD